MCGTSFFGSGPGSVPVDFFLSGPGPDRFFLSGPGPDRFFLSGSGPDRFFLSGPGPDSFFGGSGTFLSSYRGFIYIYKEECLSVCLFAMHSVSIIASVTKLSMALP